MATFIFVVWTILHATFGCDVQLSPIYSHEHVNVTFQFKVNPDNQGVFIASYQYENSSSKTLFIVFPDGSVDDSLHSVTFIGDRSIGNISFVYTNVNRSDGGVYQLSYIGDTEIPTQCVTLFILGTPTVPTVVINRIPDEGEDIVLTCSGSRSTTVPAGHNLTMVYSWTVDDVINPVNHRYNYTTNREQFNLTNVNSIDAKKHITCRAVENVSGGLNSAKSSVYSVQLYYGPDNIQFDPENLAYEQNESSHFGPVDCKASCFPACTYRWDMTDVGRQASNNGTLHINRLTNNDAGTYICNATNQDRVGRPHNTVTKQLNISVLYGPINIALLPSKVLYREQEGYHMSLIRCTSECYPCQYSWSGPVSATRSELSLGVLTRSLHGRYTCTAKNKKTNKTITTGIVVKVVYGPDDVIFDPKQVEYGRVENTTFPSINCTASCYSPCTYIWQKIGQLREIGAAGILNLGYLQRSMAGIYRCTATNPERAISDNTATQNLTLHVIYGPDNIRFDPNQDEYEEVENTTLRSINCTTSCYPTCTYIWEKLGETGQIGVDGILNLGNLQRFMAGIYRCTATNLRRSVGSGSMATSNVSLHVIYGPDSAVISEGHSLTVTEGSQHASITCTSDCHPSCTSSWISITGGSADISGDVLSLGRITRSQVGKYKCTTSNTDREYQHTADAIIDITIYYAPEITAEVSPNTEFVEGNYIELRCNATGIPSNYNYIALTQTFGSATIPNPRLPISTMPLHSSLRFDALRLEDTGTYTCEINNGVEDIEGILNQVGNIEILVQASPKTLAEELTFAGAILGNVMINVPFYSFPPADSITFTRQDGIQIQNSYKTTVSYELSPVMTKFYGEDVTLNGTIAYLEITDIRETDFTNYTLEVTNSIGRTRTVINLIPQSAPRKPTSFNRHVGETDVVVSWKAGFHGGSDQTFVLQLSKDKELWLNNSFVFGGKNTIGFQMNATLDTLSKGTQYYVRIYAFNIHGSSPYSDVLNFTTHREYSSEPAAQWSPNTGSIIGGVLGSAIILVVGTASVIFLLRRRNRKPRCKKMSSNENHQITREGQYTSMQHSPGNESEYLEINREQGRSSNGNKIPLEGPYTSMQYSADNESEYLEINREHGQLQIGDRNVYVNLQLNPQQ